MATVTLGLELQMVMSQYVGARSCNLGLPGERPVILTSETSAQYDTIFIKKVYIEKYNVNLNIMITLQIGI